MELSTTPLINEHKLRKSSEVLRALAHPLRMRILEYKIYSSLKLEQSITSQHLRILRQAELVETERRGKFIHYRLRYDKIDNAVNSIREFERQVAQEGRPGGKASARR